ncbi:MAG: hypothetical protein WCR42_06820 [bacterium]
MKIILISIAVATLLFLNSCNECPICEQENQCKVREATITIFNPRLEKINDSTWVPVPGYSIHSFLFPEDDISSGTLPNETPYLLNDKIQLAEQIYNDGTQDLNTILLGNYPTNERMVGDILLIDADTANQTVVIRVSGEIYRLPNNYMLDDANLFCKQYIPDNQTEIGEGYALLSQYGKGFTYAANEPFSIYDFKVFDMAGNEVAATPPAAVVNNLLMLVSGKTINLTVRKGKVFLYRARNGRTFVFAIANISQSTTAPYKKRITILFTAL